MLKHSRLLVLLSVLLVVALIFPSCAKNNPTTEDQPLLGGGVASWIAEKLAAGAVGYIGGEGLGWALSQVGMGDETNAKMMAMLQQISQQLANLQKQMDEIKAQLNLIDYNVVVASLGTYPSDIMSIYNQVQTLAGLPAGDPSRPALISDIQNLIRNNVILHSNAISNAMLGTGFAGGGLIEKYSRAVSARHHFFNHDDSDMQQTMFQYWDQLQAIELELLVEYAHSILPAPTATGATTTAASGLAMSYINNYNKNRAAQSAKLPAPLPPPKYASQTNKFLFVSPPAPGDSGTGILIYAAVADVARNFSDAKAIVADLNKYDPFRFYDWHLPHWTDSAQSADMRSMFQNPTPGPGGNLRAWIIAQGWDDDYLPSGDISFWTDSPTTVSGFPGFDPFVNKNNGHLMFVFTEYNGRGGYVNSFGPNWNSYVIAVRSLQPGEFYFYK